MGWFGAIPLLGLPVLMYNLQALLMTPAGVHEPNAQARLGQALFTVPMTSGAAWTVTFSDLLVFVSLVILFIELLKSTTSRQTAIVNHSLSMLLFIVCLVEFLLLPAFATSGFFLLSAMVLLDVLAGFIVTIASVRRDIDIAR